MSERKIRNRRAFGGALRFERKHKALRRACKILRSGRRRLRSGDAVGAYALFFGKKRRVGKFRLLSFYRLGGAEYVRLSSRIQKYGAYEQGQSRHQRRGTRHERRGLYV